ncbi:hypothetical protein F751_2646 [Auxenochlorella protothecoides]|uniref:Uncharacterized protein n=1 Tax=Auxenochlorella protothecoides TaxID=3075 RepID=A0A087SL25_AUXPR|nr:hypothetical protein F751_2646 [Auxenochlorella protothecoides]KFM26429.1 hypothetical protein F751_2646 [Auxenochlorella protothecoides]
MGLRASVRGNFEPSTRRWKGPLRPIGCIGGLPRILHQEASGGKLLDRGPSAPSGEPTHLPPQLLEPASVPQAAPRALLTCKCLA